MPLPQSPLSRDEWRWFYCVGQAACILFDNGAGMLRPKVPFLRRKVAEGNTSLWLEPWDDRKLKHEQCRKGVSAMLNNEIRVYTGRKTTPPAIVADEFISVAKSAGPWNAIVRQMAYDLEDAVIADAQGGDTYVAKYALRFDTKDRERPTAPELAGKLKPFGGDFARAQEVVRAVGIRGRILDRPEK